MELDYCSDHNETCGKISQVQMGINTCVKRPFFINLHYCHEHEQPFKADFLSFMEGEIEECKHAFSDWKRSRYYIKHLPKEYKPFSMIVLWCPKCSMPMQNQFILYVGGVDKYPKVGDMKDLELSEVPEPILSHVMDIEKVS